MSFPRTGGGVDRHLGNALFADAGADLVSARVEMGA